MPLGDADTDETAVAAALELWSASRERAVEELTRTAERLARCGATARAADLRRAARHLRVRALEERSRAAALRAAPRTAPAGHNRAA
jgi:hypothetical protein